MSKSRAAVTYHAAVASLPCVLCELLAMTQPSATEVHHLRADAGMGQRSHHFNVAALCGEQCHRGPNGVHGDRSLLRIAKVSERDLADMTAEKAWSEYAA